MPPQVITIDTIPFHVLHEGPSNAPLVVLIHALMATNQMWDSTVLALHDAGYSTLRYDHIGHGSTPPPASGIPTSDPWHFDYFTTHIRELVRAVTHSDVDPYAVVGCSMGGVLALRYAMLYPGSAKRIIACDMPGMTALETSKQKWRTRMQQFREEGVENLAHATVERWFPGPCPPEIKEKALQQTRSCTFVGYSICAEAIMNYDYDTELEKVGEAGEKVMVLVGENDEAVGPPEILLDVARRVKGAQHVVVKDAGHIPPMHRAEEFERIVLEFLSDSGAGTKMEKL